MSGSRCVGWQVEEMIMRKAMNLCVTLSVVLGVSLFGAACLEGDEGDGGVEVEDELPAAPDEETSGMEVAEAGGVGSVAPGAEATEIRITCPAGFFCLWQHIDKQGSLFATSERGCINLVPWGFNDQASSWRNRTTRNFRVYEHANCRGRFFTARSGGQADRLAGWNDRASSVCSGASCP